MEVGSLRFEQRIGRRVDVIKCKGKQYLDTKILDNYLAQIILDSYLAQRILDSYLTQRILDKLSDLTQRILDKIEITDTRSLEMNRMYTGFDDAVSSRV